MRGQVGPVRALFVGLCIGLMVSLTEAGTAANVLLCLLGVGIGIAIGIGIEDKYDIISRHDYRRHKGKR